MIKYLFILLFFILPLDVDCQYGKLSKSASVLNDISIINQDNYTSINTYIQFQFYFNKKMYVLSGNKLAMNLVRFNYKWELGLNAGVGYDFFKKKAAYYDHVIFGNIMLGYNFNNLMGESNSNMENSIMAGYKFVFEPYRKTSIITGLKYNIIFMNDKNISSLHLVLGLGMTL
jgi:hypothetical protein